MYDLQDWAAVQRVYKQTRSKRATAKILGMSRNTVRSLLEEKEAPVYKRTVYKSKIDDFKEQIISVSLLSDESYANMSRHAAPCPLSRKSDNTAETAPSPVDFLEWITDC